MVAKQRVVDNFSGDALNERWNTTNVTGSDQTYAMVDAIDGGFRLDAGTTSQAGATIDFNNKRQYDAGSSGFIMETKISTTTTSRMDHRMIDDIMTGSFSNHYAVNFLSSTSANWYLQSKDGGTQSNVVGTTAADTNWHTHQVISISTNIRHHLDGDFDIVKTTNLPTASSKVQPIFTVYNGTAVSNRQGDIRYLEAYNLD